MYNYKSIKRFVGMSMTSGDTAIVGVNRTQEGIESFTFIPFDPANTDYQEFLKYQAEGGKVYGADEEVPDGQAAE